MLKDHHESTLTQQDEIKRRWKEYAELYRGDLSTTDRFTEEA